MMRLVLVLGLAAFSGGVLAQAPQADLARLEAARTTWQSSQDGDYQFRYQKYCDCDRNEPKVTVVTVADSIIADVHHLFAGSDGQVPAREGSLADYWTIDDLFDKLVAAYARDAAVRVNYDAQFGFPSSLYIDYLPDLVGEETDLRNISFESR
jgi:hypothetical protein